MQNRSNPQFSSSDNQVFHPEPLNPDRSSLIKLQPMEEEEEDDHSLSPTKYFSVKQIICACAVPPLVLYYIYNLLGLLALVMFLLGLSTAISGIIYLLLVYWTH